MKEKEPLGMLLYGYSEQEAFLIRGEYEVLFENQVIVIGASGLDDARVCDILSGQVGPRFSENENRVLMFLGFSDEEISLALKHFPVSLGIRRPLFCGLTESNYEWTIGILVKHLLEENAHWEKRSREGRED
jgi:hypothetical protein